MKIEQAYALTYFLDVIYIVVSSSWTEQLDID